MAAWPGSLQQYLSQENFGLDVGPTTIRSQNEIGPDKVRRRSTRGIDKISGSIFLTVAEYSVFRTFFDTTVNGGVTSFTALHPITGITSNFRFVGTPSVRNIGGGAFVCSFAWEDLGA